MIVMKIFSTIVGLIGSDPIDARLKLKYLKKL